jgi:hypothetical protein
MKIPMQFGQFPVYQLKSAGMWAKSQDLCFLKYQIATATLNKFLTQAEKMYNQQPLQELKDNIQTETITISRRELCHMLRNIFSSIMSA